MFAFQTLVQQVLGLVPKPLRDKLIAIAKKRINKIESRKIAQLYARALFTGADAVAAAAVRSLLHKNASGEFVGDAEVSALLTAYLQKTREQATVVAQGIETYMPFKVAVEVAKMKFGADSEAVKIARAQRKAALHAARQDVREILQDFIEGEDGD
jgi:hypothetical protein